MVEKQKMSEDGIFKLDASGNPIGRLFMKKVPLLAKRVGDTYYCQNMALRDVQKIGADGKLIFKEGAVDPKTQKKVKIPVMENKYMPLADQFTMGLTEFEAMYDLPKDAPDAGVLAKKALEIKRLNSKLKIANNTIADLKTKLKK